MRFEFGFVYFLFLFVVVKKWVCFFVGGSVVVFVWIYLF